MEWTAGGWLRCAHGSNRPALEVPAPDLPRYELEPEPERDDFDSTELNIHFQTLRVPEDESWLSLTARPGFLRLRGRESLSSRHHQSLVARRWQSFRFEAETCVEFEPSSFKEAAGLICIYDVENWFYLALTRDEGLGKSLKVMTCDNGVYRETGVDNGVSVEGSDRVCLKAQIDGGDLTFLYSTDGAEWLRIGPVYDASRLSDEYCREGRFTGAFVGLCCQDLAYRSAHADFDYFTYRELRL